MGIKSGFLIGFVGVGLYWRWNLRIVSGTGTPRLVIGKANSYFVSLWLGLKWTLFKLETTQTIVEWKKKLAFDWYSNML